MHVYVYTHVITYNSFPGGSDGKESACNAGDPGFDPWVGKIPWRRRRNPLQYSCLENSMDRGAWWANSPLGYKELDTTEQLSLSVSQMHTHTFIYV